jgi:hypothetical protein
MRKLQVAAVLVVGLFEAACLVDVEKVSNPGPAFSKARHEAAQAAKQGGRAHSLNVLAYDPKDEELVRVSVPMWLVKKMDCDDSDLDFGDEKTRQKLERHLKLEEIQKAGPGLLVEVEEEDGEQVLVWLR